MWLLLGQFDQYPTCAFGMDKRYETPFGPNPRLVVNERDTLRFEAVQDGFQVIHAKADVVDTAAALGQKLPDGRIGTRRLQKFQATFTDWKHGYFDALLGNDFGVGQVQSQRRPVKSQRLLDGFDGNAKMVNLHGDFLEGQQLWIKVMMGQRPVFSTGW